jgi:hypothetical protein
LPIVPEKFDELDFGFFVSSLTSSIGRQNSCSDIDNTLQPNDPNAQNGLCNPVPFHGFFIDVESQPRALRNLNLSIVKREKRLGVQQFQSRAPLFLREERRSDQC